MADEKKDGDQKAAETAPDPKGETSLQKRGEQIAKEQQKALDAKNKE